MTPEVAMPSHAPFSRLQLAAALIEYDNDTDIPEEAVRYAQDSAIFAHFRQNPAIYLNQKSKKSDYLGVSLPSDTGSTKTASNLTIRRSRNSLDTLQNPFYGDNQSEAGLNEDMEELEVDLEYWGLNAFVSKDKQKSVKAKGKEPAISSTRSQQPFTNHEVSTASPRRGVVTSKSISLGGRMEFRNAVPMDRRRSLASPLELAGMESDVLFSPRSPTSRTTFGQTHSQMHPESSEPNDEHRMQTMASKSVLETSEPHLRNSLEILNLSEDNPFTVEPLSHTSRFDPKAPVQPLSHSDATREPKHLAPEIGQPSYPKDRPYSTLDLLRPKFLVMPSPLQPSFDETDPEPQTQLRNGFELSTDGPPLPPGARSSRRLSTFTLNSPLNDAATPNAFTPNPLLELSLSQKTFRNSLVLGAQPLPLMLDLPRATEDGDQVTLPSSSMQDRYNSNGEEMPLGSGRPVGKLYGKSLIDDLEARKAELRSKQRVFKGDDRPSMMARKRLGSSTLLNPDETISQPGKADPQSNLVRRGSTKPLLDFNLEKTPLRSGRTGTTPVKETRSVFGTDTLWEREMEKLKEIQLREAQQEEENRKAEAASELKKHGRKKKHKKQDYNITPLPNNEPRNAVDFPASTSANIQYAKAERVPPKVHDTQESSDSDNEQDPLPPIEKTETWHVDSSDEEEHGPRKTTGVGLRYPKQLPQGLHSAFDYDSEEEDMPLFATVQKAKARATLFGITSAASDEEDKPLAQILLNTKSSMPVVQPRHSNLASDSDSEDEKPLALRASILPRNENNNEDDDIPLALRSRQHQTSYQMFAQQQQQLLMQAQMQNNMFMNATPMMGGFYGAFPLLKPVIPMQTPLSISSPPPVAEDATFGRVDRWRRDVVVDGDT